MTDTMVHLTSRVPGSLISRLEELAKERRKQTGENVSRADLVREALEKLTSGDADRQVNRQSDFQALGDDDEAGAGFSDFGTIVLNALEELVDEAERQGIEDAQDMALTIAPTAEQDPRTKRLRAFVKKLHGTLQSV